MQRYIKNRTSLTLPKEQGDNSVKNFQQSLPISNPESTNPLKYNLVEEYKRTLTHLRYLEELLKKNNIELPTL